jgi:hypothetical protein
MTPVPSVTALLISDLWEEEQTEPLYMAADYLISLLLQIELQLGSAWHLGPQPAMLVDHFFFTAAQQVHRGEDAITEAELELAALFVELFGFDEVRTGEAALAMVHHWYDVLNRPATQWLYDLDLDSLDLYVSLMETLGTFNDDNITTYIIEPDRIAYFHVASFMNNMFFDAETLTPFFEEIQDYEHLIIDLRGNAGGMAGHFPISILSMLINEELYFTFPEFFVASERTEVLFVEPSSMAMANLYGIFPAAEFVESQNMTEFNTDDLALLDYAIVWESTFAPAPDAIPFGGEIWVLIDGGSASASVIAAKISAETGFATVVGEPTARVTAVTHTFVPLPNTGVLFRIDLGYTTDKYGRSIEEFGFFPQIPNAPGMDALETVLAIINEEA